MGSQRVEHDWSDFSLSDFQKVIPMVKNLPVMWETPVRSLGQEEPLEKGMSTYSQTRLSD